MLCTIYPHWAAFSNAAAPEHALTRNLKTQTLMQMVARLKAVVSHSGKPNLA